MEHEVIIAEPKKKTEIETHPDTRSYVDRMFQDFDPETGKTTVLPVRAQNGAQIDKMGSIITEPNTIPVVLNFAGTVADFNEMNGIKKGDHIVIVGGQRQGKASLGTLRIPLSQIDYFCANLQALKDAVNAKLPELMKQSEKV